MTTSPASFYRRSEDALANGTLRSTLQRITGRILNSRSAALDRLPESDEWRTHARRIRAHTLSRLDEYLDQFVSSVEAAGGHVHFAATADDAVRYVRELASSRGLRRAVKSKSMISEEIELNGHLEADGVRVVETDLGEYVVQINHDHPSHIVMPIIHMTKGQVADVFREKLGATDADVADVGAMTQLARRILRQEFIEADLGISGVNFGVAETGSICICTNEGNGRLVTTMPKVHIAMMGIERLVPTVDDLGVMLQVLGRSATGQNLTVYSNVITGPRRGPDATGEADGPEELHVVLLDNGRSRILGSELAEILYCIRCGACLNACPVYQQIGGHAYGSVYGGPVGSVLTPGLEGIEQFHELPHASTLCGACREVCPVRIDIPRMLLKLRADAHDAGKSLWWVSFGLKAFRAVATRPTLFRVAGNLAARATRLIAREGWVRRLPFHMAGWTQSRDFPVMPAESFQARWKRRQESRRDT
ncbi:MAG: LutB/LldF family L-lactate oxidation iron-sulfur protein [Vicinamibacterales bacterium]